MAWPDLVEAAHAAFLDTWGIPATLAPQSGSGTFSITGIIKNPGMEEQNVPGGAAGTGVLRFWVDFNSPLFLTVPSRRAGTLSPLMASPTPWACPTLTSKAER